MRRAIDASRAFTELLAGHQAEALNRLNEIIFACSAEIETVQKEAKALVHMIEDHSKATVGRLVDLRARVNRLAQYVAEGGAGPEQAADDLNRQKAVEAVERAVIPTSSPGVPVLPLAQLTPAGDAIQGEAA